MIFTHRQIVEFQHCDPAGIVFYPRYFEMISSTVERFFTDALDAHFGVMHVDRKMGVPMARIDVDFPAPSRLEDHLALALAVLRIGRSSAALTIACTCDGEPRFNARATIVYADMSTGKSTAWPDDLRTALEKYLSDAAA